MFLLWFVYPISHVAYILSGLMMYVSCGSVLVVNCMNSISDGEIRGSEWVCATKAPRDIWSIKTMDINTLPHLCFINIGMVIMLRSKIKKISINVSIRLWNANHKTDHRSEMMHPIQKTIGAWLALIGVPSFLPCT